MPQYYYEPILVTQGGALDTILPNTTITLANIENIKLYNLQSGHTRIENSIAIPGATSQMFANGLQDDARFSMSCAIRESTGTASRQKVLQLMELVRNHVGYPFVYIQFPQPEIDFYNGWYEIESLNVARDYAKLVHIPFTLNVWRKGTLGNLRLATLWSAAAETYSWGGATLTAKKLISLPYNMTYPNETILNTYTTSDGTIKTIEDPTNATVAYKSSATIADWFLSECKVYDSVVSEDTTEANWIQVYDKTHVFSGDVIIQNGLLRIVFDVTLSWITFYAWESVSSNAWVSIGILFIKPASQSGTLTQFEVTKITSEEIRFRAIYQGTTATNISIVSFTLRRGMFACRCNVKAQNGALAINDIYLSKSNGYTQIFNASANGAGGAGDLATDADDNYHCGYNTTDNTVTGFVLLDKPTYQPTDAGVNALSESGSWTSGQTKTFFVMGWAQSTSSFNLTTGRTVAAIITRECMYSVNQELILVSKGYIP